MKKYIILLFATLILGFASVGKTKADCPPGWFEHTNYLYYQYEVNGAIFICKVWVNFCCQWDPVQRKPRIILKTFYSDVQYKDCLDALRQDPIRWNDFLNFLYSQVVEITHNDPNCFPPCPPCGDAEKLYYELRVSRCVKWVSKPAIEWHNEEIVEWAWGIESCDENNFCLFTFACCSEWDKSPPKTNIWLVSVEEYGTLECPTTAPQVPPPGKEWEEPWETECFSNPCGTK